MLLKFVVNFCYMLAVSGEHTDPGTIIKTWKSYVALKGSDAQIACRNDSLWYYWSVDGNQNIRQPVSDKIKSFFAKESNVRIPSVQLSDAGTYECYTRKLNPSAAGFIVKSIFNQLSVIDKQECQTNGSVLENATTVLELHGIEMQCSLEYRGNLSFAMEWRKNDNTEVQQDASVHNRVNRSTSALRIRAKPEDLNSYFTCTTLLGAISCFNIPECKLLWKSPTINVLYSPRNTSISPNKSAFIQDEQLTCLADANPKAEYHWTNTKSGGVQPGQTLKVDKTMICMESCSYECIAENQYGLDRTTVSFTNQYEQPPLAVAAVDSHDDEYTEIQVSNELSQMDSTPVNNPVPASKLSNPGTVTGSSGPLFDTDYYTNSVQDRQLGISSRFPDKKIYVNIP